MAFWFNLNAVATCGYFAQSLFNTRRSSRIPPGYCFTLGFVALALASINVIGETWPFAAIDVGTAVIYFLSWWNNSGRGKRFRKRIAAKVQSLGHRLVVVPT
jgi:hypothetical protein